MPSPAVTKQIVFDQTQQLVEMTTSTITLTAQDHGARVLYVTSGGSTSTHCAITLPASSASTKGARYTIASAITGTPTSRGIYIDPNGTDTLNGAGAGLGVQGGTSASAQSGAAITLVDDGSSNWVITSANPAPGGALTNCWVTT